jgi:2-polyprenyl-6-methoxyphenol hydroxylase-like FAD-dependent oxidoreductase
MNTTTGTQTTIRSNIFFRSCNDDYSPAIEAKMRLLSLQADPKMEALDAKLEQSFYEEKFEIEDNEIDEKNEETSNSKRFIGVKIHVLADLPKDRIELHHFPGGYCGISAIEENKYCLCYLIDAQSVKSEKGDLEKVENQILSKNPELKRYLNDFKKLTERVSTAGVFFKSRPLSQNGMLFIGDSAGMIPPLAGNGMSMAMHAAIIAIEEAHQYLAGKTNSSLMKNNFEVKWKNQFGKRLKTARILQTIMQTNFATRVSLQIFNFAPPLFKIAAKATHGVEIPIPDFEWQKKY